MIRVPAGSAAGDSVVGLSAVRPAARRPVMRAGGR